MGLDVFLLLLGFTLLKMAIGLALVRQGMRSLERPAEGPPPGGGERHPYPPRPPRGPDASRPRRAERRRPHERPARRPTTRVA